MSYSKGFNLISGGETYSVVLSSDGLHRGLSIEDSYIITFVNESYNGRRVYSVGSLMSSSGKSIEIDTHCGVISFVNEVERRLIFTV